MWSFSNIVETVGLAIDALGVLVIATGVVVSSTRALVRGRGVEDPFGAYRQELGRWILLGLEVLIAADIIRTVAVAPTLDGVLVLGLIVLIRTVLSLALEFELSGRRPWPTQARDRHTGEPGGKHRTSD